jgi:hypothetical protein
VCLSRSVIVEPIKGRQSGAPEFSDSLMDLFSDLSDAQQIYYSGESD